MQWSLEDTRESKGDTVVLALCEHVFWLILRLRNHNFMRLTHFPIKHGDFSGILQARLKAI